MSYNALTEARRVPGLEDEIADLKRCLVESHNAHRDTAEELDRQIEDRDKLRERVRELESCAEEAEQFHDETKQVLANRSMKLESARERVEALEGAVKVLLLAGRENQSTIASLIGGQSYKVMVDRFELLVKAIRQGDDALNPDAEQDTTQKDGE